MKISKGLRIAFVLILMGVLVAAASAKDIMMFLKGDTLDFNRSSMYITYRDDFLKDAGFAANEVAKLRIVDNKVTLSSVIVAGIGALTAVIGILVLVIGFLSTRKKNDSVDFY